LNIGWLDVLALVVPTGLLAALANQGFAMLREYLERTFRMSERLAEQEHQGNLRRIEAHFDARADNVELARSVRTWLCYEVTQRFSDEHDIHSWGQVQPTLSSSNKVVDALDQIAVRHPTKQVRETAASLETAIDLAFNQYPVPYHELSMDHYMKWLTSLEELIELMHDGDAGISKTKTAEGARGRKRRSRATPRPRTFR
jgi:hypothetical protein